MPYIKKDDIALYDEEIRHLVHRLGAMQFDSSSPIYNLKNRAGHLNYIITTLIKKFYQEEAARENRTELCYAEHNEIIGMLECCKQEWYRHIAGPYEDKKIKENGDV